MYSLKVTNNGLIAAVGCAAPACGSTPLEQCYIVVKVPHPLPKDICLLPSLQEEQL
jgi:hypothetical protein